MSNVTDAQSLKDMGFSEKQIKHALKECSDNFNEALEYLLSHPSTTPEEDSNAVTPISRENIIEHNENEPPHITNWTNNSHIQVTGDKRLDLGYTDYHYYWGSARASVKVGRGGEKSLSTGTWYYEVTLNSRGNCRIGWCIPTFNPGNSHDAKVGDGSDSWGIDGTKQKKYHQAKEESFGRDWSRGDIIGTMIDFDTNKIYYTVNGSKIECAFTNVTADQLIPCFSLQSKTKITVNFGPNFSHKPNGAVGLNSSLSVENKNKLEVIYNFYSEEGIIQGVNTLKYLRDMGATGATHPIVGVVAWKMNASKLLTITLEEWMCTWALNQCFDVASMKSCVTSWLTEIQDKRCFTNYYNFLFKYLKLASTSLPPASAIRGWMLCGIDRRWGLWNNFKEHVEKKNEPITLSTWNQLLNFIDEIGDDPSKYDPDDGSWPLYLEEFAVSKLMVLNK
eukprot:TRINITY_DN16108_c0_g1_i1.p1 TRINITY_DN16108_c0_g1~~TRINITY_DN16108_c0_g1_i1.p1  ORF type:complete len:449 (+),score=70.81 TRINITY_DN16108_c0_g1_i1:57-1403(+)